MLLKCKIGIISFPVKTNQFPVLHMGEIYDSKMRDNIAKLYELNLNLKYITSFNVTFLDGKPIIDNIEDIMEFQKIYKLTRKIYINSNKLEYSEMYLAPKLYDIDCMVPLFLEDNLKLSSSLIEKKKITGRNIFILLPYYNPIERGEIINNCLDIDNESYFIILGSKSCILSKRYLYSKGVLDKNIIIYPDNIADNYLKCSNFQKYIVDILLIIDKSLSYQQNIDTIFIVSSKKDISSILKHIKALRYLKIINQKFNFIC